MNLDFYMHCIKDKDQSELLSIMFKIKYLVLNFLQLSKIIHSSYVIMLLYYGGFVSFVNYYYLCCSYGSSSYVDL